MATRIKASSVLLRLGCRGGNNRPAASVSAAAAAATTTRATTAVARFLTTSSVRGGESRRYASAAPRCGLHPYRFVTKTFSASSNSKSRSANTTDDDQTVSQAQAELEKLTQQSKQSHRGKNEEELIYEGSIAHHVRGLKRISITTCIISILAVPAVVMFGKESVTVAGQVAVMGTALVGTGSSTLLLNLCVSPYVFRMTEVLEGNDAEEEDSVLEKRPETSNHYGMPKASGRRFRAERMNVFGVRKTTEFSIDEVEPMPNTSRPFVSFKAGDHHYFIQGHDMADKVLLQTLLGRELKDHEK